VTAATEGGTGLAGKMIFAFVVLHVLCCGVLLLGAAGLLAVAGGLLGQPLLVGVGVLLAIAAVAVGIRRTRRSACIGEQAGTPRAADDLDRTTA
jgi:hypothetical protein